MFTDRVALMSMYMYFSLFLSFQVIPVVATAGPPTNPGNLDPETNPGFLRYPDLCESEM